MPLVTHLISIMLLFCLQRDTRARANTHILRNTARSQAYSRLMVNAWNISVPYQTASILAVDVIFLARAVGAVFKICNGNNQQQKKRSLCVIIFFYCLSKLPVFPLCSLMFISLFGMCSRKQNYFFQFSVPSSSYLPPTLELHLLGLQSVGLKRRQCGAAELMQSVAEEIHSVLTSCLFFMWTHTGGQWRRQLLHDCDLTCMTPRGRTVQYKGGGHVFNCQLSVCVSGVKNMNHIRDFSGDVMKIEVWLSNPRYDIYCSIYLFFSKGQM